jgi:hypothetical protein
MRLKLCAGAFALATLFLVPSVSNTAFAAETFGSETQAQPRIDIARIKNVLRLTPEQQAYWPPVEAALRGLARHQPAPEGSGLVKRISNRVTTFVLDSAAIARIGAAARPLVRVLDDRQKQDAVSLVHEMGLGPVLAALN